MPGNNEKQIKPFAIKTVKNIWKAAFAHGAEIFLNF